MKLRFFFTSIFLFVQLFSPATVQASHCPNFSTTFVNPTVTINPATGAATGRNILMPYHLECIYENFIGVVAPLIGLVAFVFIAYGGFKFVTAQGDQKATASAKNTLTIAVFGLVMALLSYFVLDILSLFTGANLKQFTVPRP